MDCLLDCSTSSWTAQEAAALPLLCARGFCWLLAYTAATAASLASTGRSCQCTSQQILASSPRPQGVFCARHPWQLRLAGVLSHPASVPLCWTRLKATSAACKASVRPVRHSSSKGAWSLAAQSCCLLVAALHPGALTGVGDLPSPPSTGSGGGARPVATLLAALQRQCQPLHSSSLHFTCMLC